VVSSRVEELALFEDVHHKVSRNEKTYQAVRVYEFTLRKWLTSSEYTNQPLV